MLRAIVRLHHSLGWVLGGRAAKIKIMTVALALVGMSSATLYLVGIDRVEAQLNGLRYGRAVTTEDWIYLAGDGVIFQHGWPRDGTVKLLGLREGSIWIVYWVPCDVSNALAPSEGYCDECFAPAYSRDAGVSWQRAASLPRELRDIMDESFSRLRHWTIATSGAIYRTWLVGSRNCLDYKPRGATEWVGGPCEFSGNVAGRGTLDLLGIDPSEFRHIFVRKNKPGEDATLLVGLWESEDAGRSFAPLKWAPGAGFVWVERGRELQTSPFNFVAVDPRDRKRLVSDEGGRLILSVDGGETWTSVFPERSSGNIRPLLAFPATAWHLRNEFYDGAFDPVFPGRVYVTSNRGLLISVDGGRSWRLANIGTGGVWPGLTICAVPEARAVFVGSRRGVLRSTDGGETWQRLQLGLDRPWWKSVVPSVPCPR
jgi:hypothetical protein